MTRDRARKKAIRARMAASGEPYNVAARNLPDPAPVSDVPEPVPVSNVPEPAPVSDADTVRAVIARATATLAESSARMEFRIDWEFAARPDRRSPGLAGRLVKRAAAAALKRVAPDTDFASLRETFSHQVSVGYLEPVRDRYLMDSGAYAEIQIEDTHFGGVPGTPLQRRHQSRVPKNESEGPMALLRLLHKVTDAHDTGEKTLRGTTCRSAAVRAGAAEFAVWVDDEHIRRIHLVHSAPGEQSGVSKSLTLDLWDFGVPVDSLDWSRLPTFAQPSP